MSIKEQIQSELDMEWWQTIEKYLPWKLLGFTSRQSAAFIVNKRGTVLNLHAEQFREILGLVNS